MIFVNWDSQGWLSVTSYPSCTIWVSITVVFPVPDTPAILTVQLMTHLPWLLNCCRNNGWACPASCSCFFWRIRDRRTQDIVSGFSLQHSKIIQRLENILRVCDEVRTYLHSNQEAYALDITSWPLGFMTSLEKISTSLPFLASKALWLITKLLLLNPEYKLCI